MREIEYDGLDLFKPLGDLADEVEFNSFSGGGQGKAPKPPTKIRGGQHMQREIKKQNYPKPTPKAQPKPR